VTVRFASADGTAQAGSDYVATNGLVEFEPMETCRTVSVAVIGDRLFEQLNEEEYADLYSAEESQGSRQSSWPL